MKAKNVIFWKAVKGKEDGANVSIGYLIRMTRITEYHCNLTKGTLALEKLTK